MSIRQGRLAALIAAAALTLAGCTGGTPGATTAPPAASSDAPAEITGDITFQTWSLKNDSFTPYFTELIAAFEKEHPGTKINWIDQPGDGYEDKVMQQAESEELPDVINLPPEFAYPLAEAGVLLDLEKNSQVMDTYVEGGKESYRFDEVDGPEGVFGFPWYLGTDLNYWNTDLLTKAGVTEPPADFNAMLDAAEKLAATKVTTISDVPSPAQLMSVTSDGKTLNPMYKDGKFVFNTPDAAKIIDRYAELYKAGALNPAALTGDAGGNVNTFNTGAVAWTTGGPNYIEKDVSVKPPPCSTR